MEKNVPNTVEQTTIIKSDKKNNKKTARRVITVVVILLLIACVGVFGWIYFQKNSDGAKLEASVAAKLGQLENKTYEEIEAELNRVIDEGNMSISINANPIFMAGDGEGTLQIENSPANHYGQEVIITLKETGEEIYRSGLLLPNYHIQMDKLDVVLEKGDHACVATFVAYDVSDEKGDYIQVGSAAAEIVITVVS